MPKERMITSDNDIHMYYHCGKCLNDRPSNTSPSEWSSLEVGSTKLGIQVWCKRCQKNVMHVDFEGQKHPANMMCKKDKVH
tara:strand:+ start:1842 stop:2084 length:243 start_codon:yes stop_codon:yes gene_type:complete